MPRHTNTVEHEQYVLRGHACIGIGEETYEVKTGDVVFIPEGNRPLLREHRRGTVRVPVRYPQQSG